MALLTIENLTKHYRIRRSVVKTLTGADPEWIKPLDNVNLTLREGEVLGVVGESGCGKSTLLSILGKLNDPTSGRLLFEGEDVTVISGERLRAYRSKVQPIFQDPFDSLNPRMRAFDLVAEVLRALKLCPEAEVEQRVFRMLKQVGLPPERYAGRFPHEMSGGERQRVGIASALVSEPRLVLADEPVSMLDVSIRAGIMDLLRDLSARMGFSCVYVSHDLSTLGYICDRVAVMYMGQIVETGAARDVIGAPCHPYTQALVAAIPRRGADLDRHIPIKGELAKPINPPPGCRFAPRCLEANEACSVRPAFVEFSPGHRVACHARI